MQPTPVAGGDATVPFRRDWGQEFAYLNRQRLRWLGVAAGLNLLFLVTGAGRTSVSILVGYATWMLGVGLIDTVRRRLRRSLALVRLATIAFGWDLVLLTVQLLLTGGGWWLGPIFHAVVLSVIAATLPYGPRRLVFVATLVAYVAFVMVQAAGWYVPEPWFDLPTLDTIPVVSATLLGLGTAGLLMLWNLIRFQEVRIERQQERWRRMVVASPYAMFVLGADGRLLECSSASAAHVGMPASARPGESLGGRVPRAQRRQVAQAFAAALRGLTTRLEHDLVGDDGVRRTFAVSYAPVEAIDGAPAVLAIANDVTAERAAARERAELERRLGESERMQLVGRLVSGVAHELNNPLTAVLSLSEQLHDEATDPELRRELDVVRVQARRARAIVRDLLRVVRGRERRERVAVSLRALADEAADAIRPRLAERALTLTIDAPAGDEALPPLHADATGLGQVFANLLANAVDASPRGGTIRVTLRHDADGWQALVDDEGDGIAEDVLPHVFEPFFTTRAPGEGTGLGLAVSLGIVEQHGGTLSLANRRGGGVRATVRFPASLAVGTERVARRDGTARDAADVDAGSREPAAARPLVLLVDDEPTIRLALSRWLTRRGVEVVTCANGREAITRLAGTEARPWRAIVCDLKMPDLGGDAVYRWVAEHRPELLERFIIATGDVASPEVAAFLADVETPVLEKPFELAALAERLRALGVDVAAAAA